MDTLKKIFVGLVILGVVAAVSALSGSALFGTASQYQWAAASQERAYGESQARQTDARAQARVDLVIAEAEAASKLIISEAQARSDLIVAESQARLSAAQATSQYQTVAMNYLVMAFMGIIALMIGAGLIAMFFFGTQPRYRAPMVIPAPPRPALTKNFIIEGLPKEYPITRSVRR